MTDTLPALEGFAPTRDTLHAYSRILGAVRRAVSEPHPLWWHASLRVYPYGLTTGTIPEGAAAAERFELRLDLRRHQLEIEAGGGVAGLRLGAGWTASELARRTLAHLAEAGITPEVESGRYADEEARTYDPAVATAYLEALLAVEACYRRTAGELVGQTGPVQLWPHHFDLAFEWFGTRTETYEEGGETKRARAQIGCGFSPGDAGHPAPYFYANPWPFAPELATAPLPCGAEWSTEGWQGALLPYAEVRRRGVDAVRQVILAVHGAAAPGLLG